MSDKGKKPMDTPSTTTSGAPVEEDPVPSLTFDLPEKKLVKAMEEITNQEILDFIAKLEKIQISDIEVSLYVIFEFQGFDPMAIIRKLLTINKHFRETMGKGGEDLDKLQEDVLYMIAANLYMGNLQKKARSRRAGPGRAKINELVAKYAMKIGSTGTGLTSDTLTFPRVAQSFPVITCRMALRLPSKDFTNSTFKTGKLPKFMRVSAFCAFCDSALRERTRIMLLHAVCSYSCDQTIVVHEGEKRKRKVKKDEEIMTPLDAYDLQWPFIEVASNSPVPSFGMKQAMMTEFEMESRYEVLSGIVPNFRSLLGIPDAIPTEQEYKEDLRVFISTSK